MANSHPSPQREAGGHPDPAWGALSRPLPGAATVIGHKGRSARRTPFYDDRRV